MYLRRQLVVAAAIMFAVLVKAGRAGAQDTASFVKPSGQISVGSASGQLNFTYPLELPPARGRYQPSLSWLFQPVAHTGVMGWLLTSSYIEEERSTYLPNGTPRERFTLMLNGRSISLSPVGPLSFPSIPSRFVPDVADSISSVTVDTSAACVDKTAMDLFHTGFCPTVLTAHELNGTTYTFTGDADPGGPWYLTEVDDVDGNRSVYTYDTATNPIGRRRLRTISYNYFDPTNPANTARVTAGLPGTTISVVDASTDLMNGAIVSVTIFEQDSSLTTAKMNAIYTYTMSSKSVQRSFPSGNTEPPTSFEYAPQSSSSQNQHPMPTLTQANGLTDQVNPSGSRCSAWLGAAAGSIASCAAWQIATWVDLDNDGRMDLVWGDATGIFWARNTTTPGASTITLAPVEAVAGSANWFGTPAGVPAGLSAFNPGGEEQTVAATGTGTSTTTTKRMMDFDGDGRPDLVGISAACPATSFAVRFNRDVGGKPTYLPDVCIDASNSQSFWPLIGASGLAVAYAFGTGVYAELVDLTGDGIADLVILERNTDTSSWLVFPGYQSASGWGFGAVLDTTPVGWDGITPLHIKGSPLQDLNGDGLPDWKHYASTYDPVNFNPNQLCASSALSIYMPANDSCWNTLAEHFKYQACAPFDTAGYNTGHRFAMSAQIAGKEFPYWPRQWTNPGTNVALNLGAFCGAAPYGAYTSPDQSLVWPVPAGAAADSYNSLWADLDGDGKQEYVLADWNLNKWIYFHDDASATSKGPALSKITDPQGKVTTITYELTSTAASAGPQLPIYSVVWETVTQGPGLQPLKTHFWYANPAIVPSYVDPNRSENLGFADVWQQDDATLQVTHTQYAPSHAFAGTSASVVSGPAPAFGTDQRTPPAFTAATSVVRSLLAKNFVNGRCTSSPQSSDYPVVVFTGLETRSTTSESATLSSTTAIDCNDVDSKGNILKMTVAADTSVADRIYAFATYSTNQACGSCVLEAWATASPTGSDLLHKKFVYPDGVHLQSTQELISGTGANGTYDTPEVLAWNGNGTLASRTRQYTGQGIGSLLTTYTYDNQQLRIARVVVSDDTATSVRLTTDFTYQPQSGLMISTIGPYATGLPMPATYYYTYDAFRRVAAIGTQTPVGTQVKAAVSAFEYSFFNAAAPASTKTYAFSVPTNFTLGSIPTTDDVSLRVRYLDASGRVMQVRRRLAAGAAAVAGSNVVPNGINAAKVLVEQNVAYDAVGRVRTSFEPYFGSGIAYVDPGASPAPAELAGARATTSVYDALSRPICSFYAPANGAFPAYTAQSACISNLTETSAYVRATSIAYSTETIQGRLYRATETSQPSRAAGGLIRQYTDAQGRVAFTRDAYQNYQQYLRDPLGRDTGVIRFAGAPGSHPTVAFSRAYDLRGRVQQENDDSAGSRTYDYLPTGELVGIHQAPNAQYGSSPSGITFKIGTLGRVVEQDRYRLVRDAATCAWSQEVKTDKFSYDTPYSAGAYGVTAGKLTSEFNGDATVAYGYDARGKIAQRDEWIGAGTTPHSITFVHGNDGSLASKTISSPFLATPVTFVNFYDSTGHLARIEDGAAGVYWRTSPAGDTGGFDPLERALGTQVDGGHVSTTISVGPFSGLPVELKTLLNPGATQSTVFDATHVFSGTQVTQAVIKSGVDPAAGTSYTANYDRNGRVIQATATGLQSYSATYSHFLASGDSSASQTASSLDNLQSVAVSAGGGTVSQTYNYSNVGESLSSITTAGAPTSDAFQQDTRGRGLLTVHANPPGQTPPQHRFDYDAVGRLIGISKQGQSLETLAYDSAGGLISRTYPSGPDQARYYVGDELTLVQRTSETVAYVHLEVAGRRIASIWQKKPAGASVANASGVIYYHRDRVGSVVATSTGGGASGVSYRYQPYGALTVVAGVESDGTASELGFSGALKLSEGLLHLKSRVYWVTTARFLQPDDVDFRRYTYVAGDPLNSVDPSGHDGDELGDWNSVSTTYMPQIDWSSPGWAGVSGGLYGLAQSGVPFGVFLPPMGPYSQTRQFRIGQAAGQMTGGIVQIGGGLIAGFGGGAAAAGGVAAAPVTGGASLLVSPAAGAVSVAGFAVAGHGVLSVASSVATFGDALAMSSNAGSGGGGAGGAGPSKSSAPARVRKDPNTAEWELTDSAGKVKDGGAEVSGGTHPGRRLSFAEQQAVHTEGKILAKTADLAEPGDVLWIEGREPVCGMCGPAMEEAATARQITIIYIDASGAIHVFVP